MPVLERVPPRDWPTLGWHVIDWMESRLVHGPGDISGKPFELDDEFAQFVLDCYRVYPRGHERAGRRVVGYGLLSMPKGRSKSELAAAVACAEFCGPVRFAGWDGEQPKARPVRDPFVRVLATEETQTAHVYRGVMVMLEAARERFPKEFGDIDIGATRVHRGRGGVHGAIEPCTAGAASKDGGKESFAVADELHLYRSRELREMHDLVRQNLQKRAAAEPWMLATTTMFEPGAGSVAEDVFDAASSGALGESVAFLHREGTITVDTWDDDDAQLASLTEAYGAAAQWHDLRAKLERDIRAPGKRQEDSARFWHNIRWTSSAKAINPAVWDAACVPEPIPIGAPVVLGFDGSDGGGGDSDETVLVAASLRGDKIHLSLVGRWARPAFESGDWRVPRGQVTSAVRDACDRWDVRRIVCDPPFWQEQIDAWSDELGDGPDGPIVMIMPTNRPTVMGPAIDRFLELLDSGQISHDGDPVLREHALNAVRTRTRSGWPAVAKPVPTDKIDALVAAILAVTESDLLRQQSKPVDLAANIL